MFSQYYDSLPPERLLYQSYSALSDAKLKCPAKKCDVTTLSPQEFLIGKCCDAAKLARTGKKERAMEVVSKYVNLVSKQLNEAKGFAERCEKWIKIYENELKKVQTDLTSMNQSLKDAVAALSEQVGLEGEFISMMPNSTDKF